MAKKTGIESMTEQVPLLCEDTVRKQLLVNHDQYANLTQRRSPSQEYGSRAVRIASVYFRLAGHGTHLRQLELMRDRT